ncbi:MAG: GntR family transcriptional regulator [Anaerolineae bacterium]|nr:GntR family transcriptional regulator [Anaerolineae bacterium]MBN8618730.1 GntR family transcriptional regulator [Anaerolineae bacterium]
MCANQIKLTDLKITPIDSSSPIPLYYQVEADLRVLLNSSTVQPGDLLPTENELAEAYDVGRHTIRTALSRLVNDNLIIRKAGHGTVVKGKQDRRQFSLTRSFTHQMTEMGLQARSIVLHTETRPIQPADPRALHSKVGTRCLIVDRLRLGNDEPIGLQRAYVVLEHCPGLETSDFATHSLYQVLSNQYHLVITELKHTVTATTADASQADLLQVERNAPLLVVNTSAFLDNGEIIESSVAYYRADKYEYTTTQISPP